MCTLSAVICLSASCGVSLLRYAFFVHDPKVSAVFRRAFLDLGAAVVGTLFSDFLSDFGSRNREKNSSWRKTTQKPEKMSTIAIFISEIVIDETRFFVYNYSINIMRIASKNKNSLSDIGQKRQAGGGKHKKVKKTVLK